MQKCDRTDIEIASQSFIIFFKFGVRKKTISLSTTEKNTYATRSMQRLVFFCILETVDFIHVFKEPLLLKLINFNPSMEK